VRSRRLVRVESRHQRQHRLGAAAPTQPTSILMMCWQKSDNSYTGHADAYFVYIHSRLRSARILKRTSTTLRRQRQLLPSRRTTVVSTYGIPLNRKRVSATTTSPRHPVLVVTTMVPHGVTKTLQQGRLFRPRLRCYRMRQQSIVSTPR